MSGSAILRPQSKNLVVSRQQLDYTRPDASLRFSKATDPRHSETAVEESVSTGIVSALPRQERYDTARAWAEGQCIPFELEDAILVADPVGQDMSGYVRPESAINGSDL